MHDILYYIIPYFWNCVCMAIYSTVLASKVYTAPTVNFLITAKIISRWVLCVIYSLYQCNLHSISLPHSTTPAPNSSICWCMDTHADIHSCSPWPCSAAQPRPLIARARTEERAPPIYTGVAAMMARRVYTGVFLFSFVILYGVIGNSVSSPPGLVERPPCNQTLSSLSSLREAALDLSSHLTDSVYVICVNLEAGNTPEGVGYSPVSIDSISVIITGNPGSVIKCCNDQQLPLSDYTQFPLIFTNSSLVIMEGIQFEGCMRPLKFKWVTRIEIISSTFR